MALVLISFALGSADKVECFRGVGIYYDNPKEAEKSKLRSDVCVIGKQKHHVAAMIELDVTESKPVVVNDQIVIREIMNMTILLDHDVIDGANMARFIRELSKIMRRVKHLNYHLPSQNRFSESMIGDVLVELNAGDLKLGAFALLEHVFEAHSGREPSPIYLLHIGKGSSFEQLATFGKKFFFQGYIPFGINPYFS